jgi:hypothetical protein
MSTRTRAKQATTPFSRRQQRWFKEAPRHPIQGEPGFDFEEAMAETKRLAAITPHGELFFSRATGGWVMSSPPITDEDVYAFY